MSVPGSYDKGLQEACCFFVDAGFRNFPEVNHIGIWSPHHIPFQESALAFATCNVTRDTSISSSTGMGAGLPSRSAFKNAKTQA